MIKRIFSVFIIFCTVTGSGRIPVTAGNFLTPPSAGEFEHLLLDEEFQWLADGKDGHLRLGVLKKVLREYRQSVPVTGKEALEISKRILKDLFALKTNSDPLFKPDEQHASHVSEWAQKLDSSAGVALPIAGLFHDCDRIFEDIWVKRKPEETGKFECQSKIVYHPRMSSKLCRTYLSAANIDKIIIDEAVQYILYHEAGPQGYGDQLLPVDVSSPLYDRIRSLSDADSMDEFLSQIHITLKQRGHDYTLDEMMYKYKRMSSYGRSVADEEITRKWPSKRMDIFKLYVQARDLVVQEEAAAADNAQKKISLVIFDMDNTLYVSRKFSEAQVQFHRKYIAGIKGIFPEDVRKKTDELKSTLNVLAFYEIPPEEYYKAKNRIVHPNKYLQKNSRLRKVLEGLYHKYSLAVVSNSEQQYVESILEVLGVRDLFTFVIATDENIKGKPDPVMFKLACSHYNIQPFQAVAVGDNKKNDVLLAIGLGMHGVVVEDPDDLVQNVTNRIEMIPFHIPATCMVIPKNGATLLVSM